MTTFISYAQDWTYDLYLEDMRKYTALPIKGVRPKASASDREVFIRTLKMIARDFLTEWAKNWGGPHRHNGIDWPGGEFEWHLRELCFSDWYKDTYGQRPHLPAWYYIHPLGLNHGWDTVMAWDSHGSLDTPLEKRAELAKEAREFFLSL